MSENRPIITTLARWIYRAGGVVACAVGVLLFIHQLQLMLGGILFVGGIITIWHSFASNSKSVAQTARTDMETWL